MSHHCTKNCSDKSWSTRKDNHHNLSVVFYGEVDHLWQLQIIDIVVNIDAPSVGLQGGRDIERIVRETAGPLPKSIFRKIGIEPDQNLSTYLNQKPENGVAHHSGKE